MTTTFTVTQTTDNIAVPAVYSGHYEEPGLEFDKTPEFGLTAPNQSGIEMYRLFCGKEVKIYRNGQLGITGIVDTPTGKQGGNSSSRVEVKGQHKGYVLMNRFDCTNYDYTESGVAVTTKNGVTVNPWEFKIFRAPGATLGIDGLPMAVDGVRPDEAMQALIGIRAIFQVDFLDNSFLLPSQVYATTNGTQVFRDGAAAQTRPALQNVRLGTTRKNSTPMDSIRLWNGDPNVADMGDISSASAILVGKRVDTDPLFYVCRNGSSVPASRGYAICTVTHISSNYLGSGLDAWTAVSPDMSNDAAAEKNCLAFKIDVGSGGLSNTILYYLKLTATVTSDTGISAGSIATYSNPNATAGNAADWIETDVQGFSRAKAVETIRKMTVSDPLVNPNPHWDAWLDGNLAFHFAERRGSAKARTYSFPAGNLKEISHEFDGTKLAYQTIAYGAGSGNAQTRIVSKEAYSTGGLYDADNDPFGGTRAYGDLPRVLSFTDANETSIVALLSKAQAFQKLHRAPIEKIRVKIISESIPYFANGDSVTFENVNTRTAAAERIIALKRSFSGGDREELEITLGQPEVTAADRVVGNSSQAASLTIKPNPTTQTSGLAGTGVYFDKDHYGVVSFPIPHGAVLDKAILRMGILPWLATSKSAYGGSGTAVSVPNVAQAVQINTAPADPFYYTHVHDETATTTAKTKEVALTGGGASGNFVYQITVPTCSTGSNYTATVGVSNGHAATTTFQMEIRKNSATGTVLYTTASTSLAAGNFIYETTTIPVGTGSTQLTSGDTLYLCCVSANFTQADSIAFALIANNTHTHTVTTPAHTHDLAFGIFQFSSDSDTSGTAAATFGTNILLAVDPTVDSNGIPTTFSTQRHPMAFGSSQVTPSDVDIDVTGYLTADANGIVKAGTHKVYFLGTADSTTRANSNGLSAVSVTPELTFK